MVVTLRAMLGGLLIMGGLGACTADLKDDRAAAEAAEQAAREADEALAEQGRLQTQLAEALRAVSA